MSTRAETELEQRLERAVHRARAPLTVIKTEIQLAQRGEKVLDPKLAVLLLEQVEKAIAGLDALLDLGENPPVGTREGRAGAARGTFGSTQR